MIPYSAAGQAWEAKKPSLRKKFKPSRLVGVEWEHNMRPSDHNWSALKKWITKWRGGLHDDSSCGLESVTPPLGGDYIANCLTDLGDALHQEKVTMDRNCSVHVHVDAYDFRWQDMYRLLWVFSRVEEALFTLAGQQRKNSGYCEPCGKDYAGVLRARFKERKNIRNLNDIRNQVLDIAYDVSDGYGIDKYKFPVKKADGRFKSLNICPWLWAKKLDLRAATVEFRLHENTSDTKRVIGWTHLLARIVDWAKNASDKEASKLSNINDQWKILYKIAPQSKSWIMKQRKLVKS